MNRGGRDALQAVIVLVHGETVRFECDGTRTYDRCVATWFLDGREIAETLVSAGLAYDSPPRDGCYAETEKTATRRSGEAQHNPTIGCHPGSGSERRRLRHAFAEMSTCWNSFKNTRV
jgi:hypothetical protein